MSHMPADRQAVVIVCEASGEVAVSGGDHLAVVLLVTVPSSSTGCKNPTSLSSALIGPVPS